MISALMISPQALSHHHTTTKASLRSVRTAHVVVDDVVVADAVVEVALAAIRWTALRR